MLGLFIEKWYLYGGRRASTWWRELVRIRDDGGSWFRENVSKVVGNGRGTFFWMDPWLGGIALSVRFRRLHDLSVNKNRTVEEMFVKGWGLVVRRGNGDGGCGIGRRTWLGSVGLWWLMFFCKILQLIFGDGG